MNTEREVKFTSIITLVGVIVVISIIAFYAFNNYIYKEKQAYVAKDYKNAEYIIGGERVRLVDGVGETEIDAKGSPLKVSTRYFGNELKSDLNGDGREDVVFLLTQNPGGTGTFYYAVAALNTPKGYIGSEAFYLGDRIAPQTTVKGKGNIIIVNYADRAPTEPYVVEPSINKSVWLLLDPQSMQFGTVEQNFEGESAEAAIKMCDFRESCKEAVKQYLLKNLATLSPEKEVLGGKFYIEKFSVDEFTVRNDVVIDSFVKGEVAYSDGHNAFTARYSFKINPDMSLTFRTFDIVK